MGECGCGAAVIKEAYRIGENVLGVEVYRGCRYCDTGLAVVLHFFTPEGAEEWIEPEAIKGEMTPSKYGGQEGHGWHFWLVGKRELVLAAQNGRELKGINLEDYENLADLLADNGLELLQEAMRQRKE